jgi:hypothetical protein
VKVPAAWDSTETDEEQGMETKGGMRRRSESLTSMADCMRRTYRRLMVLPVDGSSTTNEDMREDAFEGHDWLKESAGAPAYTPTTVCSWRLLDEPASELDEPASGPIRTPFRRSSTFEDISVKRVPFIHRVTTWSRVEG